MLTGPRPSEAKEFRRTFLAENWARLLYLALLQAYIVYNAANDRWFSCALWSLVGAHFLWVLLKRAAGVPGAGDLPTGPQRDLTPREAFWLDPTAVFDRGRRNLRVSG